MINNIIDNKLNIESLIANLNLVQYTAFLFFFIMTGGIDLNFVQNLMITCMLLTKSIIALCKHMLQQKRIKHEDKDHEIVQNPEY